MGKRQGGKKGIKVTVEEPTASEENNAQHAPEGFSPHRPMEPITRPKEEQHGDRPVQSRSAFGGGGGSYIPKEQWDAMSPEERRAAKGRGRGGRGLGGGDGDRIDPGVWAAMSQAEKGAVLEGRRQGGGHRGGGFQPRAPTHGAGTPRFIPQEQWASMSPKERNAAKAARGFVYPAEKKSTDRWEEECSHPADQQRDVRSFRETAAQFQARVSVHHHNAVSIQVEEEVKVLITPREVALADETTAAREVAEISSQTGHIDGVDLIDRQDKVVSDFQKSPTDVEYQEQIESRRTSASQPSAENDVPAFECEYDDVSVAVEDESALDSAHETQNPMMSTWTQNPEIYAGGAHEAQDELADEVVENHGLEVEKENEESAVISEGEPEEAPKAPRESAFYPEFEKESSCSIKEMRRKYRLLLNMGYTKEMVEAAMIETCGETADVSATINEMVHTLRGSLTGAQMSSYGLSSESVEEMSSEPLRRAPKAKKSSTKARVSAMCAWIPWSSLVPTYFGRGSNLSGNQHKKSVSATIPEVYKKIFDLEASDTEQENVERNHTKPLSGSTPKGSDLPSWTSEGSISLKNKVSQVGSKIWLWAQHRAEVKMHNDDEKSKLNRQWE